MSRPSQGPLFDHSKRVWCGCSLLQPSTTSSHLGPNILLSTLFSNIFNLWSSLSMTDQVSHPYKNR
jgi:hypothetical protein